MKKIYPRKKTDQFPSALVNVTNRCTLSCKHCFVFRKTSPNRKADELDAHTFLEKILEKKRQHGFKFMLWMGGEPLLRADILIEGVKHFESNNITTNGSLDLIDLENTMYVVSVDGPPEVNDAVRGKGSFERAMRTLARIPDNFRPKIMVQCVVTRKTQYMLEPLVDYIRPLPVEGLTFTFYVPTKNDTSELAWPNLTSRDTAVREIMRIKEKHRDVIRNHGRSLELMLSNNAKKFTDDCSLLKTTLPLYLHNNELVTPFCCYGNDVDCDLCGSWAIFHAAVHQGM
jgi:MoaA/NifB/PqqE/SkfB family radical SAM enzyme